MKKIVSICIMLTALLSLLSGCGFGPPTSAAAGSKPKSSDTIIIGSKNFSENIVLGTMMYDLLKAKLKNVKIESQLDLASTLVAWTSIQNGQIDIYPEYTGTGLVDILKKPASNNTEQVYQNVKHEFDQQYHISWLDPIGFNNTYAVAVPRAIANKYHLKKVSDLVPVASQLTFGADPEFFIRQDDGFPALNSKYGLNFQSTRQIDAGLKYLAIASDQFQVTDAYSTDGALIRYDLVILQDDKHLFPPYYAAPIVREDTLKAHPEIAPILNELSSKIDNETMKQLNYQVDVLHKSTDDVAHQFLVSHGLLPS